MLSSWARLPAGAILPSGNVSGRWRTRITHPPCTGSVTCSNAPSATSAQASMEHGFFNTCEQACRVASTCVQRTCARASVAHPNRGGAVARTDAPAVPANPPDRLDVPFIPGRVLLGVKVVFVLAMLRAQLTPPMEHYAQWNDARRPAVDGAWDVDEIREDGAVAPQLLTDRRSWRHVFLSRGFAAVRRLDGSWLFFRVAYGDASGTARLEDAKGIEPGISFERDGEVATAGWSTPEGRVSQVRLRPTDPSNELLVRRGFHWVNERPFNR